MITQRNPIFRRFAWVGVASALFLAAPFAMAQEEGKPSEHQLSEKVGEALQKLKPLQDAKNYTGMLELVNAQLKTVAPTSYDAAYLLDLKAKIYLQLEQYGNAIEPWEQSLRLSEQYNYKDEKERLDITKFLAQLIYSEATVMKDKVQQQQTVARAAAYLKKYVERAKKQEPEVQILYASILYAQAIVDEQKPDIGMLKEAIRIVEQGMLGSIRPKDSFYMLQLAILQQLGDYERAAEVMELLLQQYPNKKDVWPMLFGTYVNLAGAAKENTTMQRDLYVRAINTIERAQRLGFMNTPRDNYNLFTLYLNAGATGIATEFLHNGMKKGTIESNPANWRVLGAYYQQNNQELQAIGALQEAAKLFPKDGTYDFLIGQIYQQMDKLKEANAAYARATKKENLGEKPHQVWLFLAYTSLELGDYDAALSAINQAMKIPAGARDPQVKSLKDGIEAMIADREAARAAAKKQ